MADRPFTVIQGGGQPEPDAELVAEVEALLARIKAGEVTGVIAVLECDEPELLCKAEDGLSLACLGEELCRQVKLSMVGLA